MSDPDELHLIESPPEFAVYTTGLEVRAGESLSGPIEGQPFVMVTFTGSTDGPFARTKMEHQFILPVEAAVVLAASLVEAIDVLDPPPPPA